MPVKGLQVEEIITHWCGFKFVEIRKMMQMILLKMYSAEGEIKIDDGCVLHAHVFYAWRHVA